MISRIYKLANKIDKKIPALADKLERTAAPHFDVPDDFNPRVIRRNDVPPDAEIMYHATNDMPGINKLGLVSQRERKDWNWGNTMGIGGGTPEYVSLTRDRKIADTIARVMRMLKDIMSSDTPEGAVVRAEAHIHTICAENDINFNVVVSEARRMFSYIFGGKQDQDLAIEELKSGMQTHDQSYLGPKVTELPPGSKIIKIWNDADPSDDNAVVSKWEQPMKREDWAYQVSKYFDYMLDSIEQQGGPVSPMVWGYSDKQFNFDPEDIGVAEVMVSGDPDRKTSGLGEWAGHPDKTRVILK